MSNPGLIIEERSRDIGDFLVGRLIPFRKKRMVGPFIFIDHMGPSTLSKGRYMDIDPHPHIGLCTLTYLFDGEILHRDSMGSEQIVKPGDVNLMTAGKGVTHTERTPDYLRNGEKHLMHGYQIWIALPQELETMEPEFFHVEAQELPRWESAGIEFILVSGETHGRKSPVPFYSAHYMLNLKCQAGSTLLIDDFEDETGLVVVSGTISACGEQIGEGSMLVAKNTDNCSIQVESSSHLLIFGGQPFPEPRHIYWNFVATDKVLIEEAKEKWRNKKFPEVINDSGYIPLPE